MKKIEYRLRLNNEIRHYKHIFKNSLFQQVPPIWNEVEKKFSQKILRFTGVPGLPEYIAHFAKGKKKIKLLSLGSGACGVEILSIAPRLEKLKIDLEITSIDINEDVLNQAKAEAEKKSVNFRGVVQDINKLTLQENSYDVIMAFASLHHFENLNRVTKEINKALKRKGIFVTVDIATRNGYLMWDTTYNLVNMIWKVLPSKYRWDHTKSKVPLLVQNYPNIDYSVGTMECTNSEAIMPALRKNLKGKYYVPVFAFARRFFDTKFGANYDLRKPFDRALFELLMYIDDCLIEGKILQPETFFGVYTKKL